MCYCGTNAVQENQTLKKSLNYQWHNEALICKTCQAYFHIRCLKNYTPSKLINDYLYDFHCASCSGNSDEAYIRNSKIPWVSIVILLLHNLQSTKQGNNGYFHYKNDIHGLFLQNISQVLPHERDKKKNYVGNIASCLSNYNGIIFLSGTTVVGPGWWKLIENKPPLPSTVYKRNTVSSSPIDVQPLPADVSTMSRSQRKKKVLSNDFVAEPKRPKLGAACGNLQDKKSILGHTVTRADSDDSNSQVSSCLSHKSQSFTDNLLNEPSNSQVSSFASHRSDSFTDELLREQSSSTSLSEMMYNEAEIQENVCLDSADMHFNDFPPCKFEIEIETSLLYCDLQSSSIYSPVNEASIKTEKPDFITQCPDIHSKKDFSISDSAHKSVESAAKGQSGNVKEESEGASESVQSSRVPSPAPSSTKDDAPQEEQKQRLVKQHRCRKWSIYEEEKLRHTLDGQAERLSAFNPKLELIRQILHMRKRKRCHGLEIFDINKYLMTTDVVPSVKSTSQASAASALQAPIIRSDLSHILDRFQSNQVNVNTKEFVPFINKLHGYGNSLRVTRSLYTSRLLRPFIWRDFETKPLKLQILEQIRQKNSEYECMKESIDYKYVSAEHVPVINRLCQEAFWPSIDLSECLQYADFSCVAMYKKLIIGFAFMVPDVSHNEAYISFIYTHPDWRGAGMASVMLYHLMQTCMGKDIMLHVSINNPAVHLYFKFGFKVVEIIHNFYDKFHPADSNLSPHAFLMKLERY